MQRVKNAWKQLPDKPRRVIVFIVGMALILTSALIGWIPGPGGMIPFLLGIAVLASEFAWAERLRDRLLELLKNTAHYIQQRPVLRATLVVATIAVLSILAYALSIYII